MNGGNNGNEPSEAHLAARGKPTSDKSNEEATREKLATRGKLASDKSNQKEKEGNKIKVWFDGGSRAASSKAGYGALIYVSDKKVRTVHEFIGAETNHCNAPGPSGIGFQDLKLVAGSKAGRLVLTDLVNLLLEGAVYCVISPAYSCCCVFLSLFVGPSSVLSCGFSVVVCPLFFSSLCTFSPHKPVVYTLFYTISVSRSLQAHINTQKL